MGDITKGRTFVSGETATPEKFNTAFDDAVIAAGAVTTAKIADANVTLAKLATAVANALVPTGAVNAFAMNSAPTGWLDCNGAAVSRTTYSALFTALSTTYGAGDGSTTFNLPDLRGYFVRGSGTNADATAAGTFGVKQADEFKSHTHVTNSFFLVNGADTPYASGSANGYALNGTSAASGGAETRPRNIPMLYCIKT